MIGSHARRLKQRKGIAAVELAILLPILLFFLAVAVDFSRISYHGVTVTNCARNGARYGCDPMNQYESPYSSIKEAALADATDLDPQPTVKSTRGVDEDGNPYLEVTVVYPFKPAINYLGLGSTIDVERTVRMRAVPVTPGTSFNRNKQTDEDEDEDWYEDEDEDEDEGEDQDEGEDEDQDDKGKGKDKGKDKDDKAKGKAKSKAKTKVEDNKGKAKTKVEDNKSKAKGKAKGKKGR